MAKAKEKIKARELRRQGKSIVKIAKEVGVTRGTVSIWCRDIELTEEQKRVFKEQSKTGCLAANEANKKERLERQQKYQQEGQQEIGDISDRDLMLIGAALYWAEGGKTTRTIQFSNSDLQMLLLFMRWTNKCLQISKEKIKVIIHIHEDLDKEEEEKYWCNALGLKREQFYKTQIKKNPLTGHRKKKLYHGTVQLYIFDANLFYKIEGMIKGLQAPMV